jgi:hypothetical protein
VLDRFVDASDRGKVVQIEPVCERRTRIQLEAVDERRLSRIPVPLVEEIDVAQLGMGLG